MPVVTDTVTALNTSGTALNPAVSATGTVNGTVNGTAPLVLDTLVRAQQILTGGTTVEVAGRFVDGLGNYAYLLPVDAPQVAPYVAVPGPLVFVADAGAVGQYTLRASLTGFADKTAILPVLTSGATITTNFTFP
ncbi:hypothetical protein LP415_21475 [Polaromonas sp. P1(28)-8]|nr:hypothetical protein LP415_21475 [Polaromonas sp. P1(28)-8]